MAADLRGIDSNSKRLDSLLFLLTQLCGDLNADDPGDDDEYTQALTDMSDGIVKLIPVEQYLRRREGWVHPELENAV